MYNLRQFRMHTRQAFDDALEGREVIIRRNDRKYRLVALVDEPEVSQKPLAPEIPLKPLPDPKPTYIDRDMLP